VRNRPERGSAVVDFVLVMVLLVPLVLGVIQVGLVLHVRNTIAAAASEGARAAATLDAAPAAGVLRTRALIRAGLSQRYADDVTASYLTIGGAPATVVHVRAKVPALGLLGTTVVLDVEGHAIRELAP
jgi:Flp pilus assembly protein TadG